MGVVVTTPLVIHQGAYEVVFARALADARGNPWDPTGWALHAVLRADSASGPLIATWRNSPGVGEGLAQVVVDPDDEGATKKRIELIIKPSLSIPWTWSRGIIQGEATHPTLPDMVARFFDTTPAILSREAVI